jgi:hypothetical protein
MEAFRDCLMDCGLADLGFSGYEYTWDNKREDGENIQVRLDRATCNAGFMQLFPQTEVLHVLTEESDHRALVIRALSALATSSKSGQRPFQYEAAWTRHEKYDEMIANAWLDAHAANQEVAGVGFACNKLEFVSKQMKVWSRDVFGSIKKQIAHLKGQLCDAKERALHTGFRQEIKDIEDQLHDLYEREEVYQKQRSRVDWLTEGDQNTQYFQNRASHRKRKNTVN